MKDYYIILGLPKEADKSRIKKAYRDIAKKLHPDKSASRENRRKFLEAKEAYETLTDEAARKKYDRELSRRQNVTARRHSPRRTRRSSFRTGRRQAYPSGAHIYKTGTSCQRDYWLKMVLSPEKARCGGDFTVTLPFIQPCPGCRHQRVRSPFFCLDCFGRGFITINKEFIVTLPPDMNAGDTFRQLAYDNGFFALFLNVVIRIDPLP
ncbi:MAG: DnaJ domain-containing protein [Desulfurivibrionaceae bacterium]